LLFSDVLVVITVVAFKEHVDKIKSELSDASSHCGLLTHAMETVILIKHLLPHH